MPTCPDRVQEAKREEKEEEEEEMKRMATSKPARSQGIERDQPENTTERAKKDQKHPGPNPKKKKTPGTSRNASLNIPMRMMHLPLRNPQRLKPHTPLPPRRTPPPIHPRHSPPPTIQPQHPKQLHINIDILRLTPHALIHNFDIIDRLAIVRVIDGDVGAAEGVVVWVAGAEFEVGDGDDGLAGLGGEVAGGVSGVGGGGVVGHVA